MFGLAAVSQGAEGGGFNPFEFASGATFWTWVIFLISLPLMWKIVFGPIARGLADRDQKVVDAAAAAEHAREQAEKAVAGAEAEREKARAEARRTVQEALGRAERQAQEASREARAEAERQLQKVHDEIQAEKQRALLEIREQVVALTIASAGRIMKTDVDDEMHRRMVEGFLVDLERSRN